MSSMGSPWWDPSAAAQAVYATGSSAYDAGVSYVTGQAASTAASTVAGAGQSHAAVVQAHKDALEFTQQAAQEAVGAGRDWLTTASSGTLLSLQMAADEQIRQLEAGVPLANQVAETHGVLATPPFDKDTASAAYYRIAYWLAVAGRVSLHRQDPDGATALLRTALKQRRRAQSTSAAAWLQGLPGLGGGLWRAGWATQASLWLLGRTDHGDIEGILREVNAQARVALRTRAAVAGGSVLVLALLAGGTGYAWYKGEVVRRNGRTLTAAERARQMRGIALFVAGIGFMTPLDEALLAVLSAGLGVPLLPLQGGATFVGGAILGGFGAYMALTPRKKDAIGRVLGGK